MQIGQGSSLWPGKRAVALAGGTGLVGRSILEGLLADPSVHSVHVLARRKPRVADARITSHIVDFAALPPLPPVDEVYLALGTTIKVAGSQAAFRAIDFDAKSGGGSRGSRRRRAALRSGERDGSECEVWRFLQPREGRT